MSSGVFGYYAPTGQLNGSSSDPFANTMGGATQIGPTQGTGSQTDPFAGYMGGPTSINQFGSPFQTQPLQSHARPFQPQNMGGQGGGGQGGGGGGGGQSSGGGSQSQSPMSMIGKVAGMAGSLTGGQNGQSSNPFSQGMWANMKQPNGFVFNGARGPEGANGQGQGTPFSSGGNMAPASAGNPNQYAPNGMPMQNGQMVNDGGNMGPASMGTPNQFGPSGTPVTANMGQNLMQLPSGGLDGGMGNLGSFLGGMFG